MSDSPADAAPAGEPLAAGAAGPRAVRGGAVRLGAFVASVLFSVGSSAVMYRYLGVVRTGHYVTITSLVALCAGLTDAGLSAIGVRELTARDRAGRRALITDLAGLRLALAALGAFVAVVFAAIAGYGWFLVLGTAVAGVAMILVVLEDTYAINLTADLRITAVALADLLRVAVLAGLIIVLSAARGNLIAFYAASIPAAACAALVNAWLVRRDVPLRPRARPRVWRTMLSDTLSFSLATAVMALYFRVALIVVSLVAGGHQTGYFAVSFRVIEVLLSVPALLVGVTFPIFAQAAIDDRARLNYAVGRVFDALWLIGVGVALTMIVGAPFIVGVIAGPHYHAVETVLRIQGVALMASFVGAVWSYTLLSLHRHQAILRISMAALVLSAALSGALAAIDGARGAAIGTAVTEILFVSALAGAAYASGVRPQITWGNVPRSLLAAGVGACALLIPGVPDVGALVIGIGVYGAGLVVLRAVPPEILEQLRPRRRAA